MNFRNSLMKITAVLAGLLVLVMIGLTVYRHQLVKKANREASTGIETAGEAVESGAPGEDIGQEDLKKQRIEFQKRMLEDPAFRESIRSGLEAQYKPLFDMLALSPEQQEKLTVILINSALEYVELNPEIMAAVSDEEKSMLQKRYDFLREETRIRVEAILGRDGYEKYQAYEDRAVSRSVVSGFAESLPPDDRLTEKQKNELIEIMYWESQKVYEDIGYDPTSRLEFPSDMDTETISKSMEITDRFLFDSAAGSWGVLSESQLEAYNDYLRTYSEQVEMSLVRMRSQYGG